MEEQCASQSIKDKIRQSLCLSCCFRNNHSETLGSPPSDDRPTLVRASSAWIRSRADELPEIRDKCRHLIGRIRRHHQRKQWAAADFRYDPLSYALNFDEGCDDSYLDEVPLRNFSSRLPVSPPLETVAEVEHPVKRTVPRGISCA